MPLAPVTFDIHGPIATLGQRTRLPRLSESNLGTFRSNRLTYGRTGGKGRVGLAAVCICNKTTTKNWLKTKMLLNMRSTKISDTLPNIMAATWIPGQSDGERDSSTNRWGGDEVNLILLRYQNNLDFSQSVSQTTFFCHATNTVRLSPTRQPDHETTPTLSFSRHFPEREENFFRTNEGSAQTDP